MSDALGILFLHHKSDETTFQNLNSIRRNNPTALIVTISANEPIRSGYSLKDTPKLFKLHAKSPARSSDLLVCSWFQQRQEDRRKWWIVEWDTFCTTSVSDYYKSVWNYPYVASNVCLRHRHPHWHWFSTLHNMPEEYRPFAIGASPFVYLMDEHALSATCNTLIRYPLISGNGELRFATAANREGFPPCGFSPPNDRITWIRTKPIPTKPTIYHPVKEIIE